MNEDPDEPGSCWEKFNGVFEWLPLGALIEGQILCARRATEAPSERP